MSENNLVSIIINCYNGENFLKEAVDSVIAQIYQKWEIIFWDNQSTDSSAKIFQNYEDARLKYFLAPKHTNLSEARKSAIEQASGEYYAFLDVDDWWDTKKLEKQMSCFNDPDVGLVYGNFWYVDEENGIQYISHRNLLPSGYLTDDLLKNYCVGLLSIIIRKKAYEALNYGFDSSYHIIGDFDITLRISLQWKIDCVQAPIAFFRFHGKNELFSNEEKLVQELEAWRDCMKFEPNFANRKGFKNFIQHIEYLKLNTNLKTRNYQQVLKCINNLGFSKIQLKIIIKIIIPQTVIQHLKFLIYSITGHKTVRIINKKLIK